MVCSAEAYDSYTTVIEHQYKKTNTRQESNNPNEPSSKGDTDHGCRIRITQVCVGPLVGVSAGSGSRGVYTEEINTATLTSQNKSDVSHGTIYSPTRRYEIIHTPQHSQTENNVDENQKDSKQMNYKDSRIGVNPTVMEPDSDPGTGARKPLCAVIELTQLPYISSGILYMYICLCMCR
jgi:hypothetical protein